MVKSVSSLFRLLIFTAFAMIYPVKEIGKNNIGENFLMKKTMVTVCSK